MYPRDADLGSLWLYATINGECKHIGTTSLLDVTQ